MPIQIVSDTQYYLGHKLINRYILVVATSEKLVLLKKIICSRKCLSFRFKGPLHASSLKI